MKVSLILIIYLFTFVHNCICLHRKRCVFIYVPLWPHHYHQHTITELIFLFTKMAVTMVIFYHRDVPTNFIHENIASYQLLEKHCHFLQLSSVVTRQSWWNNRCFLIILSHRMATQVFPAVRAVGGVSVGRPPFAPPAILSPTAARVTLELEVGTVSAASPATGTTALLAARVSHLSLNPLTLVEHILSLYYNCC